MGVFPLRASVYVAARGFLYRPFRPVSVRSTFKRLDTAYNNSSFNVFSHRQRERERENVLTRATMARPVPLCPPVRSTVACRCVVVSLCRAFSPSGRFLFVCLFQRVCRGSGPTVEALNQMHIHVLCMHMNMNMMHTHLPRIPASQRLAAGTQTPQRPAPPHLGCLP